MDSQPSLNECPSGFVVPNNPENPRNFFINRDLSNCTFSCFDSPIFSNTGNIFVAVCVSVGSFTTALIGICACLLFMYQQQKLNLRYVCARTTALVLAGVGTALGIISTQSASQYQCMDNTVPSWVGWADSMCG